MPRSFLVRRNSPTPMLSQQSEAVDDKEKVVSLSGSQSVGHELPAHFQNICSVLESGVSSPSNGNILLKQRPLLSNSSLQFTAHCSCVQCRFQQMTPSYTSYCSNLITFRQTYHEAYIAASPLPECSKQELTKASIIDDQLYEPAIPFGATKLNIPSVTSGRERSVEEQKFNELMVSDKKGVESSCVNMADQMIKAKPNFQCEQCGKVFKTKYTLNIHCKMPSHTTSKPFVCPTCGKGFRLSSTLCRHKIIHTTQRPHCCHICNKSFNRSSTLKTHLRTHSNQKEFICDQCGKGFHQKGNLRNHALIHTGEKPYSCSVCKKSFNKLSNLKFHMHSHTDQKPYRCRFCKTPFCRRGELKLHISRFHRRQREGKSTES